MGTDPLGEPMSNRETPEDLYDGIIGHIHDIDIALEYARRLYNHLVEGGEVPDRPRIPDGFCNHTRRDAATLSGLAVLCRDINRRRLESVRMEPASRLHDTA